MAIKTVLLTGIVAVICFGSHLADGCSYITSTQDWCRGSNYIVVAGQRIPKGVYTTSDKRITLPGLQTEINWNCGSTQERAAWGPEKGNQLRVKYHSDGKIQWEVYECDLSGPKEAGKQCVAMLREPYHCPKSDVVGNSSEPCMFELQQSTTRSHSETTTVSVKTTLRAEVTASREYAEAKASAEVKASKSKSVTDAVTFHYQSKTFVLIPADYVYCALREGTSVADINAPTGFKWDCSTTKFVQVQGGSCTNHPACDHGVCAPSLGAGVSIQVGPGLLSLGLVASLLTLLL